ncbi:MAG TPA: peptidase M28, partial [Candidatus Angelobacter sp.]|nr:peptidase M28 [Candidatus Angelobacter sp.]
MKMIFAVAVSLVLTASPLVGQALSPSSGIPAALPDPQIAAALKNVSSQRIQQTIEKLVSFQSRHTLSADVPAASGQGINAAAEWIKSELESYSKACGGCLEVKTDEFIQDTANRIPKPTRIVNVYAVLRS